MGPSGEQFEIALGDQRVVVTEVGGGLRAYSVGDRQVLDGYDAGEMCSSGRGQVLIPWPNRIVEGSYEFGGRTHQLPINEHVTQSAIHGLVRWAAWKVAEREKHRVVVVHDLHPQPGYPFALALRIEYALSDEGLRVSTRATNVGVDACPYRRRSASVPPPGLSDGRYVDPAPPRPKRARGGRAERSGPIAIRGGHRVRLPEPEALG